ncbi:MAG: hypothetical protein ACI4GC_03330 [Acutalibacteraceae bacterium]
MYYILSRIDFMSNTRTSLPQGNSIRLCPHNEVQLDSRNEVNVSGAAE